MKTWSKFAFLLSFFFVLNNASAQVFSNTITEELRKALIKRREALHSNDMSIPVIKFQQLHNPVDPEHIDYDEVFEAPNIMAIFQDPKIDILKRNLNTDNAAAILRLEVIAGGAYSGNIFIAHILDNNALTRTDLPSRYIVKQVTWRHDRVGHRSAQTPQKELQALNLVGKIIIPKLEAARNSDPSLPYIPASRGVFKIQSSHGLAPDIFLAIMDLAAGDDVYTFFDNYANTGAAYQPTLNETMKQAGLAVGAFHLLFSEPNAVRAISGIVPRLGQFNTTIHGDLHFANLFWAPNHVDFIDVATMADFINQKAPCVNDLAYMFVHAKYARFIDSPLGFNWINEAFQSFADGYASGVAPKNSAAVKAALIDLYKDWSKKFRKGFANPASVPVAFSSFPSRVLHYYINLPRDPGSLKQINDNLAADKFAK